jgi:hypothetical protein
MTDRDLTPGARLFALECHLAALALRQSRLAQAAEVVISERGFTRADWLHLADELTQFACEAEAMRVSIRSIRQVVVNRTWPRSQS